MKFILLSCPECGSTALTLSVSSMYAHNGSSLDGHVFCDMCHNGVWVQGSAQDTRFDVLSRVSAAWNIDSVKSGRDGSCARIEVSLHA